MNSLGLLVPTRGRPDNAIRLAHAVREHSDSSFTALMFIVDYDDPEKARYLEHVPPTAEVHVVPVNGPKRMGPVLNYAVKRTMEDFTHLGFMGDDHLPCTPAWDKMLVDALDGQPGVAYGNDLFQGEKLPTAAVISTKIIRSLGYMSPPPLEHLYVDDFWKELGHQTKLAYRPDVVIAHLHPAAGKAAHDPGYAMSMSPEQTHADRARWEEFRAGQWQIDLEKLRRDLRA